jgi:hypothetical protein
VGVSNEGSVGAVLRSRLSMDMLCCLREHTYKTMITFRERPKGEPPALRAWFYPDARWGDEFVHGKKQAKEIAQATEVKTYNPTGQVTKCNSLRL